MKWKVKPQQAEHVEDQHFIIYNIIIIFLLLLLLSCGEMGPLNYLTKVNSTPHFALSVNESAIAQFML